MATTPSLRVPRSIPFLYADDVAGYLEFLAKAFVYTARDPEGHQWFFATVGSGGA